MLDLMRLKVFIYCADSMSFSQAAKELHLSQPTISHHIKSFESEIGLLLFDRSGGRLQLTEAGRRLVPWARKLVQGASELENMMIGLHEDISGNLCIYSSTTAGKWIVPALIGRFRQRYPGVRLSIKYCRGSEIVGCLLEEGSNIGIVNGAERDVRIEFVEFFLDPIVLIAANDHPWRSRYGVNPWELIDVPLILREEGSGARDQLLAELAKHEISIDNLNVAMEIGNEEAIVKTVEGGFGVAFVSRLAAEWAIELGSVVEIPVKNLSMQRWVYLARNLKHTPTPAVQAFWAFVQDPENEVLLDVTIEDI
jgi:DNA-binding transcriptional LysR family regulator